MVTDGFALETEIGLFAMKRDMVNRYLQHFKDVNVEVHVVQMAPLRPVQLRRLRPARQGHRRRPTAKRKTAASGSCVVALDIGTDNSNLVITDGEQIIWQRPIPLGGNHFTRALTKDLKLTFAKAEHLKRNATKSPDLKKILTSLKPVLNDFVGEVQRSLGYFTNTHRDAQIEYMVGLGNAFRLPGLQKFLHEKLQLEVRKLPKFERAWTARTSSLRRVHREHPELRGRLRPGPAGPQARPVADQPAAARNPHRARWSAPRSRGRRRRRPAARRRGRPQLRQKPREVGHCEPGNQVGEKSVRRGQERCRPARRRLTKTPKSNRRQPSQHEANRRRRRRALQLAINGPIRQFDLASTGWQASEPIDLETNQRPRTIQHGGSQRSLQKAASAEGQPSAADKQKHDPAQNMRDDEYIKKHLVQINIEGMHALYCDDISGYFKNVKIQSQALKSMLDSEAPLAKLLMEKAFSELSDEEKKKIGFDKGWVVEIRGYTYHKDGDEFIKDTIIENLRQPEMANPDIFKVAFAKTEYGRRMGKPVPEMDPREKELTEQIKDKMSFLFLFKSEVVDNPEPASLPTSREATFYRSWRRRRCWCRGHLPPDSRRHPPGKPARC